MNQLIGRKKEQQILREALDSNQGEMVAVVGRRRVGKTFLVDSVYKNQMVFRFAGIQNGASTAYAK